MHMVLGFIRTLFAALDGIVYSLLETIYNLMNAIANTDLMQSSTEGVGTLTQNIYAILGVIMLFKVAFSLLSYIVNPNAMSDNNNGAAGLVKNIVICIGLTLIVPIAFDKAMELQRIILKDDIIGRIITGVSKAGGSSIDESAGQKMSFNILAGFVKPNAVAFPECENNFMSNSCYNSSGVPSKYADAISGEDREELLSSEVIQATTDGNDFVIDYSFLISTGVGLFVCYILFMFCLDISVRAVKLMFLRVIAPIPIASYVDPKGQKGVFSKWVNLCVSTYLDLFVRLAGIYFALYIVENVVLSGKLTTAGMEKTPWYVTIFLILGCLMFAKQLPKLIEDITGLKMGGGFTLNPLKKMAEIPLIGGAAAGAGALAGAGFLAGGRMLTGSGKAIAQAITGNTSAASATMASTTAMAGARMRAGGSAFLHNVGNLGGSGKYETSGKGYSGLVRGKDAGVNAIGKQLYAQYGKQVNKSFSNDELRGLSSSQVASKYQSKYSGLLKNSDMQRVAGNLEAAKNRRNGLQSRYEQMQTRIKQGANISAADLDKARVDYVKSSADYDKINKEFSMLKNSHKSDAERYDAFMKESDSQQAQSNAYKAVEEVPETSIDSSAYNGESRYTPSNGESRYATSDASDPETIDLGGQHQSIDSDSALDAMQEVQSTMHNDQLDRQYTQQQFDDTYLNGGQTNIPNTSQDDYSDMQNMFDQQRDDNDSNPF